MIDLQIMTPEEQNYVYAQSQQISMQTGYIGCLQGGVEFPGTEFYGFYSTWKDFRKELKTDKFKAELDDLINSMRFDDNGILKNCNSLEEHCFSHMESAIESHCHFYGFRVSTEQYTYLMRLNPHEGEYCIYCYLREPLERHMKKARNGIRFVTPDYKERFCIPDSDSIRIFYPDGTQVDRVCRYIDDTHFELMLRGTDSSSIRIHNLDGTHTDRVCRYIGGTYFEKDFRDVGDLYHICQFAELMEQSGKKVIPLRSSLPKLCYSILDSTNEVITIERGVMGYTSSHPPLYGQERADDFNRILGHTKAQAAAMKAGSLFGWDTPAADPKNYDEQGQPIKPKHKDRGDAR